MSRSVQPGQLAVLQTEFVDLFNFRFQILYFQRRLLSIISLRRPDSASATSSLPSYLPCSSLFGFCHFSIKLIITSFSSLTQFMILFLAVSSFEASSSSSLTLLRSSSFAFSASFGFAIYSSSHDSSFSRFVHQIPAILFMVERGRNFDQMKDPE